MKHSCPNTKWFGGSEARLVHKNSPLCTSTIRTVHWCFIYRKCSTSLVNTEYELKMARILTTRVSCVHEQHHLIHFRGFRHLQIYCSSPTTSEKNLDVGPSYDARYFVYEVGGEARNNSLARNQLEGEVWIYNWGTTWGYWCHIVWLTYTNIFLWICQINANINYLVVCLNTMVYLIICLLCDQVGTNAICRRYMEISFNYLVYFGGHIWINGNVMVKLHQ